MKKFLLFTFAMVAAAISHAVTIAWVVPPEEGVGSGYDWADENTTIKIVYSASNLTTAQDAYDASKGSSNVYQPEGAVLNNKLTVWANNVAPTHTHTYTPDATQTGTVTSNLDFGDGAYYYLVVERMDEGNPVYAVAGLDGAVTATHGTKVDDKTVENGVYANLVGGNFDPNEYYDGLQWMLNGETIWHDAVPEPTIMALLALGVAGLALRRKQNFTK